MAAAHAIPDGCAYPAQRRRLAEDASPAPPVPGREGRRWRVHAAVAGGAAAALFALSCTVALGAPFSARPRQHGTQLLQWFGLAQGTLNEGRAPDAGNVMARTLGMREGTIPKVMLTTCTCVSLGVRMRTRKHAREHAATARTSTRLLTHTNPANPRHPPPTTPKLTGRGRRLSRFADAVGAAEPAPVCGRHGAGHGHVASPPAR